MSGRSPIVADVVIAGAGIAGIATAWALAERGAGGGVVLVDPRPPLTLTSDRPEANYRTWWPHPAMVSLATRSLERIDDLRRDGADIPLDRRGYLFVSDDPSRAAALPALVAGHPATAASEAEALDGEALRRRWPHLGPGVAGGILVGRAGGLDTVALGRAMLERATRRGVLVVRGGVSDVHVTGGRVSGVAIEAGDDGPRGLACDVVVDAAGPFAGDVARLVGAVLPLETVLRQKVVVRDAAGVLPRDAPFTITLDGRSLPWTAAERRRLAADPAGRRLLEPLPGGIHVKPDDTSGADALKLGWAWDQTPAAPEPDPACPPDFPRMVLLGASTIIPGLGPLAGAARSGGLVAHEGGFYARTPDGRPLIGAIGGGAPEGVHAVAGLSGFGAMMAAAAGEHAADVIGGSRPASAFDPGRFDDPAFRAAVLAGAVATGEL